MDHETLFLMGVYLLPLGFVSLVSAWAGSRKPWLAILLTLVAAGLFGYVHFTRPEGLFGFREIPDLTIGLIARIAAVF